METLEVSRTDLILLSHSLEKVLIHIEKDSFAEAYEAELRGLLEEIEIKLEK